MSGVRLFRDIAGKRYGHFTVLSYAGTRISPKNGNCYHLWSCQCDCGTIKVVQADYLLDRLVRSCGCKKTNAFVDRTGERYGKLVILSYAGIHTAPNGQRSRLWLCQCDCGNTKVLPFRAMSGNHTRSCGCLNREVNLNNTYQQKPRGVSAFNQLYASYKKSARERKLCFNLTETEFREITQSNCFYCGLPPSQSTAASTAKTTNGDYIYTGIDRIDNSKGYTLDNVKPCCKQCNYAKRDLSEQAFLEWATRLALHLASQER